MRSRKCKCAENHKLSPKRKQLLYRELILTFGIAANTLVVAGAVTDFNWPGYENLLELLCAAPVMAVQANRDS